MNLNFMSKVDIKGTECAFWQKISNKKSMAFELKIFLILKLF
jgi:hypothetical protein